MEKENGVFLEVDCSGEVSYLYYQAERLQKRTQPLQQNGFSFLHSVTLHNPLDQEFKNLTLHFECVGLGDKPLVQIDDKLISVLPKCSSLQIDNFTIVIDATGLYWLDEAIPAQLVLTLSNDSGEILTKHVERLDIQPIRKSYNPNRLKEILVSYVTPRDPRIIDLVSLATTKFQDKYGDSLDLCGYQTRDSNYVLKELDALYLSAQQLDLKYVVNGDLNLLAALMLLFFLLPYVKRLAYMPF